MHKIQTIHTNEHNIWPRKPNMGENLARRWGLCSTLFSSVMESKYKERGPHYGVSFDTVAWMDNIEYHTYSFMLSKYHSLDDLLNYGTSTIQNNGTLSPHSGPIFNIAW